MTPHRNMTMNQNDTFELNPNFPDRGIESAFYGRLSDADLGRESSIPDQLRECRDAARRNGGYIPDSNVFSDVDVRGITESRPGLDRLLDIVRSGKATFRDLYIADTSRLARSATLAPKLRKFFKYHKIRLHFVENGMHSDTTGFEIQHHFQSFYDEQFSQQLGEKVRRAQVGLVLRGYHPAGLCYGYKNVAEEHGTKTGKWGRPAVIGVKQVKNQEQADVILQIFNMYADGCGYCDIARKLWEMGIDPPRKGKKNEGKGWSESAVMHILNNERYIGRVTYGKTRLERDEALTLQQRPVEDESEWTKHHNPKLQIVPDELWARVKARQALVSGKIGREKAGGLARSSDSWMYLFSGLLICGLCHSSMVLTGGFYRCSKARRKMGCSNSLSIKRESLERQLIDGITSTILSETIFDEIKLPFMTALADEIKQQHVFGDDAPSRKQALLDEQRQLEAQLRNLAEEVAKHGSDDALRAARRSKGARLEVVKEMLKRVESPAKLPSEQEVEAFLRRNLSELADVLLGDPRRAKQELQKRITSLTLTPVEIEREAGCEVTGDLTLFTPDERMMLQVSCTRNLEHHPLAIKLDGVVLKAQHTRRSPGRFPRRRSRAIRSQTCAQQASALLGELAAEAA
jgi:site-specific DNA recombinase